MSEIAPDASDIAEDDQQDLRLADPDNYNVSRRLRQLHDAKERVRDRKDVAHRLAAMGEIREEQRDELVAEAAIDYVRELEPLLAERVLEADDTDERTLQDELHEEGISAADIDTTVAEFVRDRGRVGETEGVVSYPVAMAVWHTCNRYFQRIAGVEFESQGLPEETGFDAT